MSSVRFNDKEITRLRNHLDFLLTDCNRYMKRHRPKIYGEHCLGCLRNSPYVLKSLEICPHFKCEKDCLCKLLYGSGLSDKYKKRSGTIHYPKSKSGRNVI